jgi:hypothetical protein
MYNAIVARIETSAMPGSDNIVLGRVLGYTVLVGKDVKNGSLGVFFEAGGQLSPEFCVANDLVRRKEADGTSAGGYFEETRRVRAMKMRGTVSEGFFCEKEMFAFTGVTSFKENEEFSTLAGIQICNKYVTPRTARAMQSHSESVVKRENCMFAKHIDTGAFKRAINDVPPGLIILSEKLHGTCVPYMAGIRMADGTKKIISHVSVGDYVMGVDKDGSLCPSKVINVWHHGSAERWVRVKGKRYGLGRGNSDYNLVCTPEHLVWVREKGYIEAETIKPGDKVLMCRNAQSLSEVQFQTLLGKLLGDGSLITSSSNARVEWGHKDTHEAYVDWTSRALQDLANPARNRQVSGHGTPMVRAQSKANYYVLQAFKSMIVDGKKIVPDWVETLASPLALAFWYMDDGSLAHHEGQEDRVSIATCGFTLESCNVLVRALARFGITAQVAQNNDRNRVKMNADDAEKFFLLVAPYIPPCMQYKLPERYRGHDGWLPKSDNVYKPDTMWQVVDSVENATGVDSAKWDLETETHNFMAYDVLVHNSHRTARVLEEVPIIRSKVMTRIAKWLKWPVTTKVWKTLHGSRNVVLDDNKPGFYGSNAFRYKAVGDLPLRKGEVVYGEIVGYTNGDSPIMGRQNLASLKDKAALKQFGSEITYSYGCEPDNQKFYVYRITQVNEDGYPVELPHFAMVKRAEELGLASVPVLSMFLYEGDAADLESKVNDLVEGSDGSTALHSMLDSRHIREGVVVRYESVAGTGWLKAKSKTFGLLEGYLKDTDTIDAEEAA